MFTPHSVPVFDLLNSLGEARRPRLKMEVMDRARVTKDILFTFRTCLAYEATVQAWADCGNRCPVEGCHYGSPTRSSSDDEEKSSKSEPKKPISPVAWNGLSLEAPDYAEFLHHYEAVHMARGWCQLYPCPVSWCRHVLKDRRRLGEHLRDGIRAEDEAEAAGVPTLYANPGYSTSHKVWASDEIAMYRGKEDVDDRAKLTAAISEFKDVVAKQLDPLWGPPSEKPIQKPGNVKHFQPRPPFTTFARKFKRNRGKVIYEHTRVLISQEDYESKYFEAYGYQHDMVIHEDRNPCNKLVTHPEVHGDALATYDTQFMHVCCNLVNSRGEELSCWGEVLDTRRQVEKARRTGKELRANQPSARPTRRAAAAAAEGRAPREESVPVERGVGVDEGAQPMEGADPVLPEDPVPPNPTPPVGDPPPDVATPPTQAVEGDGGYEEVRSRRKAREDSKRRRSDSKGKPAGSQERSAPKADAPPA